MRAKAPAPTVFIIDDDPAVRTALARLMRSASLAAETFASGEEFLAHERPAGPGCSEPFLKGMAADNMLTRKSLMAFAAIAAFSALARAESAIFSWRSASAH